MARLVLFIVVCLAVLGGCVPAKKLVYLQKDDELKKRKEILKDSVLRVHPLNIQEYKIQPLDILSVLFETLTDVNDQFDFLGKLSQQAGGTSASATSGIIVNTEGQIEYPVLGNITVAGLTLFQAKDSIQAIAARYIPDVIVRVRMLNFRFTVLGEVGTEKTVVSPTARLTISEAIGLAGGLGEYADRSNVKVIRQIGSDAQVYYIDLLKEDFLESKYYYVQQNDVIIVPPLRQRTFKTYYINNLSVVIGTISVVLFALNLTRN